MGIKNLNNFLINNCSISKIHLSEFQGKKIAVDASIYLYRFLSEEKLVEHTFQMVSILSHYNISPIFVFDGTPPPEKKDVINERREKKQTAQDKYELLKQTHTDYDTDEMQKLKRQFIHVKHSDYVIVKSILTNSGITWVTAPGEADELCAHLMHTNQVYACLSDDMDMFAYGCHRVLRHFSLVKHNVLYYNLHEILFELQLTVQEFRQILVLSGTDYNNRECNNDLNDSVKWFRKYKKEMILCEQDPIPSFYDWLSENSKYIQNLEKLNQVLKMFRPKEKMEFVLHPGQYNKKLLCEVLAGDGFLFSPQS
jgi:flap endonuclease-1